MEYLNKSYLEVKKSKFYGYLYNIDNTNNIEIVLETIKKENKKAKHIVYAYKIGNQEKIYSDKEPSGTCSGILGVINSNNLDNTLIVVVRYFGGTLLGVGPLTRTYTKVSSQLIKKDKI